MSNPLKLNGIWNEGYALDYHTVSSEYLGEDPFGNKIFDNTYTEVGNLLHRMKYNGKENHSFDILNLCIPFLDEWLKNKQIDCILPIPPSKERIAQPTIMIAEAIAKHYNIPCVNDVLHKNSKAPSKTMTKESKDLTGTIDVLKCAR